MRRITILDEEYVALEGALAKAIDSADEKISESRSDSRQLVDSVMSAVKDKEKFHLDPAFMNFKNDPAIGLTSMGETLSSELSAAASKIKELSEMSISDVALLSKAYAALMGISDESYNDEVEEATLFFGMENVEIPDSKENEFKVQIGDAAKQEAFRKITEVRSALSAASTSLGGILISGGTAESLMSEMEKMSTIRAMMEPLSSKKQQ